MKAATHPRKMTDCKHQNAEHLDSFQESVGIGQSVTSHVYECDDCGETFTETERGT